MAENMYFLYILRSKKDLGFYTGITNNLNRRLSEHNGHNTSTRSTLKREQFELLYVEECINRGEARKREIFWKSGQGREYRDMIFK